MQRSAAAAARQAEEAGQDGMVIIPGGRFVMGSPPTEQGRTLWEGPQREVIVRSFALSKFDVTRAEYARFVSETGYNTSGCAIFEYVGPGSFLGAGHYFVFRRDHDWRSPGFAQTDRDPAVCVSWDDAQVYIRWLSAKTGRSYRLPTEAEWEYAARGGTTTSRYWGDDNTDQCRHANGADQALGATFPDWSHGRAATCSDGYVYTSPVGSFPPNRFGLYDMLGNFAQWTLDCFRGTLSGTGLDRSYLRDDECTGRVLRGSSWSDLPMWALRAAGRMQNDPDARLAEFGFRLARTLP